MSRVPRLPMRRALRLKLFVDDSISLLVKKNEVFNTFLFDIDELMRRKIFFDGRDDSEYVATIFIGGIVNSIELSIG